MSDRELLEMAAKAVGYEGGYYFLAGGSKGSRLPYDIVGFQRVGGANWNPLTDDGAALRLAIDLKIDLLHPPIGNAAAWDDPDRYAKKRRAIVLAAFEIGKVMP